MKRSTMNLMLAAAALLAASTAAPAQTMTAEVPFSFSAGGKVLPAGKYTVSASIGEKLFEVSNAKNHYSVLLNRGAEGDPQKEWTSGDGGVLLFDCSDGCALRQIWTNRGYPSHRILSRHDSGESGSPRLAVIRLAAGK